MKSLVGFLRVLSSDLCSSYRTFNASNLLILILFADDTNVFMSHKAPNCLLDKLNLEMDKLSIWFKANKLSLNHNKTNLWSAKKKKNVQFVIFNKYKNV